MALNTEQCNMANYFNTSLRNLIYRLRKYREILDEELKTEIMRNKDVILKMITEEQLYDLGIEGRGIKIWSYQPYTARTIRKKHKKGQPYDRVTLKDTGKFYLSLDIKFDEHGFYVTSSDGKAEVLLEKYGKTIFRLTNANLKILLNDYIRPSLKEKFKAYIQYGR